MTQVHQDLVPTRYLVHESLVSKRHLKGKRREKLEKKFQLKESRRISAFLRSATLFRQQSKEYFGLGKKCMWSQCKKKESRRLESSVMLYSGCVLPSSRSSTTTKLMLLPLLLLLLLSAMLECSRVGAGVCCSPKSMPKAAFAKIVSYYTVRNGCSLIRLHPYETKTRQGRDEHVLCPKKALQFIIQQVQYVSHTYYVSSNVIWIF